MSIDPRLRDVDSLSYFLIRVIINVVNLFLPDHRGHSALM